MRKKTTTASTRMRAYTGKTRVIGNNLHYSLTDGPQILIVISFISLGIVLIIGVVLMKHWQPISEVQETPGISSPTTTVTMTPSAPPTITATLTPVPVAIENVDPIRLTSAIHPWHVVITGKNLSAVQTIVIEPVDPDHNAVTLSPIAHHNEQIRLDLNELYPTTTGQVTYTLVINDQPTNKQIIVQDFIRRTQVLGIHNQHFDRNPQLFYDNTDGFGAFLWEDASLQTKVSASPHPGDVVISLDDTVEILEAAHDTHDWPVYHVRIRKNRIDGDNVIGKTGWISQWLIDGRPIPPAPTQTPAPTPTATPRPVIFSPVILQKNDSTACEGGGAESPISGTVYDVHGSPIRDTAIDIQITSLHGNVSYRARTLQGGYAQENLSCGLWRVELRSIGGNPVAGESTEVFVTGGTYGGAVIDFRQR